MFDCDFVYQFKIVIFFMALNHNNGIFVQKIRSIYEWKATINQQLYDTIDKEA